MLRIKDVALDERSCASNHTAEQGGKLLGLLSYTLAGGTSADRYEHVSLGNIHVLRLCIRCDDLDRRFGHLLCDLHSYDLTRGRIGGLRLCKYLVSCRTELRSCRGSDDLRHDVTAECGAYLHKVGVFLHFKDGTVCGESRATARRNTRSKLTAEIGRADEYARGLIAVNKVAKCRRVGLDPEFLKRGVVIDEHLVSAISEQLICTFVKRGSDSDRVHGVSGHGGKLPCLSEQLKRYSVYPSARAVGVNANPTPERFVNFLDRILHKIYKTAALPYAHLTHLTSRRDIEHAVFICNRVKGTYLYERLCIFFRNEAPVDYKLSHFLPLLISSSSNEEARILPPSARRPYPRRSTSRRFSRVGRSSRPEWQSPQVRSASHSDRQNRKKRKT